MAMERLTGDPGWVRPEEPSPEELVKHETTTAAHSTASNIEKPSKSP